MAYYDALVAKWATLTGTTQQKLDQINALTITGSVPTSFFTTGAAVLNCIAYSEFKVLTDQQKSNLLNMLAIPGPLLGGSANTAFMVDGMIIDYFLANGPITMAALTALAKAAVMPWWQAPVSSGGGGLNSPVSTNDLLIAGGLV